MGYSFRLTARVLLYAPSHRQDNTYHGLCYTSRGVLAGTRNNSVGPLQEGSIWWPIAPWANVLTMELHLAPHWFEVKICLFIFLFFFASMFLCFLFPSISLFPCWNIAPWQRLTLNGKKDIVQRTEGNVLFNNVLNTFYLRFYGIGSSEVGSPIDPSWWTYWHISRSSQCSTTGVTVAVVCTILSIAHERVTHEVVAVGFHSMVSEWSFVMCLLTYNHK